MKRKATATWQGSGKEGSGQLTTQTNTLKNVAYNWSSRFADGTQTNPGELIAAAHAGCFSMKLSFVLGEAGIVPELIETSCVITLEGGAITGSHLTVAVKAAGLTRETLDDCATKAKENCPVSKSLGIPITMEVIAGATQPA